MTRLHWCGYSLTDDDCCFALANYLLSFYAIITQVKRGNSSTLWSGVVETWVSNDRSNGGGSKVPI